MRRLLAHAAARLAHRLNPTDLTNPALHGARPPAVGSNHPRPASPGREPCSHSHPRSLLPTCLMPNAQCPMPNAQCPMPNAHNSQPCRSEAERPGGTVPNPNPDPSPNLNAVRQTLTLTLTLTSEAERPGGLVARAIHGPRRVARHAQSAAFPGHSLLPSPPGTHGLGPGLLLSRAKVADVTAFDHPGSSPPCSSCPRSTTAPRSPAPSRPLTSRRGSASACGRPGGMRAARALVNLFCPRRSYTI